MTTLPNAIKQLVGRGFGLEAIGAEYLRQAGWEEFQPGRHTGLWNHRDLDYWALSFDTALREQRIHERRVARAAAHAAQQADGEC